MRSRTWSAALAGLALAASSAGCGGPGGAPDGGAPPDAGREPDPLEGCTPATCRWLALRSVDEVDLLLMVDNSNSMGEEQASLALELPRLVQALASGDLDLDGVQDFLPVRSLHVGIVTSDMGAGGNEVPTCSGGSRGALFGDDGLLQTEGCGSSYPPVFEFMRGEDPDRFAADVACVAVVGTGGCGFEQQLEAVLKAVSPSSPQPWTVPDYVPPTFFRATAGHADGANAGLVRADSVLATVLVTDEEDCSVLDPELFDLSSTRYSSELNLRCFYHPEAVRPIDRYVLGEDGRSGLLGLRALRSRLIFAGIVGVPVETVPDPRSIDYDAILDHPRMQERMDPTMPSRLVPSCEVTGRGVAFPPRRIVRVAQEIARAGGRATIQSICQASFSGALDAIVAEIGEALGGGCLPEPLPVVGGGMVACRLFEVLPGGAAAGACDGLPGRSWAGRTSEAVPREVCEVAQIGPGAAGTGAPGWYYEDASTGIPGSDLSAVCAPDQRQRIALTTAPAVGGTLILACPPL